MSPVSSRFSDHSISRRQFIERSALAGAGLLASQIPSHAATTPASINRKALISISLDLENCANFPKWEDTSANFDKGNLGPDLRGYAVEAARRVKARGGVIHFFLVGRGLEQEDVGWLKEIIALGHSVGNHTYHHVNLLATTPEATQFIYQRAPWLIAGKNVAGVLRENIQLTNAAFQARLGSAPVGFRTPGGFRDALNGREDLQKMLLELGFTWVSSKYPAHLYSKPGTDPTPEIFADIVAKQALAQPYVYPTGLIEIPMSPISDIGAFRNSRWKLDQFLHATRLSVEAAIKNRAMFDLLAHPGCLAYMDPEFKTIDLVCDLAKQAGDQAVMVDLATIARHVSGQTV